MHIFTEGFQNTCSDLIQNTVNVQLVCYTHIPLILLSLFLGTLIYIKNKDLLSRIFLSLSLSLSIFLILNLITWLATDPKIYMFFWSLFSIVIALIFITSFYFTYVFIFKKDLNNKIKILTLFLLFPIFVITPTDIGLEYFDSVWCFPKENFYFLACYIFGFISMVIIPFILIIKNKKNIDKLEKTKDPLFFIGIESFVILFFFSSFLVGYLNERGILNSYELEKYGYFGVVILLSFLTYLIVRFKAFNIKLIATQALVWIVVILVGSQFLFIESDTNKILNSFTLVSASILGLIIVRSVKKEIALREDLARVNNQQNNLLHFISHQVKGFFTKSRNAFSGLLEGDYGPIPETARHIIQEGFDSDNRGVQTVQELLSAANFRTGQTTYNISDTNIINVIKDILLLLKPSYEKKSLPVNFNSSLSNLIIKADTAQITQALKNLIDNSIKYTPSGKIDISLEQEKEKVVIKITDTGVGITHEDMQNLFKEGGRGKESLKVNVDSTGYGLYIVKNIIEAHGGSVTVFSEGTGKGSVFTVVLPVK